MGGQVKASSPHSTLFMGTYLLSWLTENWGSASGMGGRVWAVMQEWGGVPWCCDDTGGGAGMCASAPIPENQEVLLFGIRIDRVGLHSNQPHYCKAALCHKTMILLIGIESSC